MTEEYGVFGNLVAIAGCLSAATAAIALSWMKRVKWQPPEEALPKGVSRMSGLVAMVAIALIYVFGNALEVKWLAAICVVLLLIALAALVVTIRTNIKYSFYYPDRTEKCRLLGGSVLTEEAAGIAREKRRTEQQMLEDLQGERDLLWTRDSMAAVNISSTISFIALIAAGTSAVAAAAMLVVVYTSSSV